MEMAEGAEAAAALYSYVAGRVGIAPRFDVQANLSPGVLVFPIVLEDAVLYILTSESADEAKIDLRDKLTGVRCQHAALALIGKRSKSILAKYGF